MAGVSPEALVLALARCVEHVGAELEPEWRHVIDQATQYGQGELDARSLAAVLPNTDPDSAGAEHLLSGMEDDKLPGRLVAHRSVFSFRAASTLAVALHPDTPAGRRAKQGSETLGHLAALQAMQARTAYQREARRMARAQGGSFPPAVVPQASSYCWDAATERAVRFTLRSCADCIRETIANPFADPSAHTATEPG